MGGERQQRRSTAIGLICLILAAGAIVVAYVSQRQGGRLSRSTLTETPGTPTAGTDASSNNDAAQPGRSDTSSQAKQTGTGAQSAAGQGTDKSDQKADAHFDYGKLPSVKGNANPQVRSVAEALRDKGHAERLSPLIQTKFNADAFMENPEAYLSVVEPGRCFQTAQPGSDTPRLKPLSPQLQTVKQGESVKLRVRTAPKGPVSLSAFDGGVFKENGLNSITVLADEAGVAEVTFVSTPGTINECNVLAGSPMASGQVKYMVNVTEP